MRVKILDRWQSGIPRALLALALGATFVSCASTKEPAPLVSDPSGGRESAIPWNKQEKWEQQGQLSQFQEEQNRR